MRRAFLWLLMSCSGAAQAATFVVDTTDSDLAGTLSFCSPAAGDCSLRGALTLADLSSDQDTIQFDIPATQPGCANGVCSIDLAQPSGMSFIVQHPIVFDGRTQPGYAPNAILASVGGIGGQPAIRLNNMKRFEFRSSGAMHGLRLDNAMLVFTPNALAWTFQGNWFLQASTIQFSKENYAVALQDVQFGGLQPGQRNWVSEGSSLSLEQGLLGLRARVEGNLFGTDLTGLLHQPADMGTTLRILGYSAYGDVLVGGADPQARNVFDNGVVAGSAIHAEGNPGRVRIEGNHLGVGVDGQSALQMTVAVVGSGFLLGGETEAQANLIGNAVRDHCTVEVISEPYAEGRALILGNRFLDNAGPTAICPYYQYGRPRLVNDAGDTDGGMPLGSPPMPGYEPSGPNLQQNAPEISAFDVQGGIVTLTYRVDSLPQYTSWPLRVEFHFTTTDAGEELLHVDSYAQAEAQQFKTISFALPAGLALNRSDVLVATASAPAPGFSTSHFSWYPSLLGFTDNASLIRGSPTLVKVQVRTLPRAPGQSAWPFSPAGLVRITANASAPACSDPVVPPGAQECHAVLQPSASDPTIAVAECAITLPADFTPLSAQLSARYCSRERAFAGRDAAGHGIEEPVVTRSADVIGLPGNDLFCDSFEDNDPGCPTRP